MRSSCHIDYATRPDVASAVEAWVHDANQLFSAVAGGFFRGANVEFNPLRATQQPDDSARQAFRTGDAITGQPLAQTTHLADTQNAFGRAAPEMQSRPGRECPEKFIAKPLDQRLGRRKKPELPGGQR